VNDKIACPACEGTMEYAPTEASSRYYVEAADPGPLDVAPPTEIPPTDPVPPNPEDEEKKEPKKLPEVGEGDIFQPVDERDKGTELDLGFGDENVDKLEAPEGEKPPMDMPPEGDKPPMDVSPEGDKPPMDAPPEGEEKPNDGKGEEPVGDMPPVIEETVPEDGILPEDKPKKKSKKDKVEFPKEDVPKFEKMPKEAADLYQASLRKYMF
jgi:hypothetical protein